MWILLIKKISVEYSPPKLSIFWAEPWQDDRHAKEQKETCIDCGEKIRYRRNLENELNAYCNCAKGPTRADENTVFLGRNQFGLEPNWIGAVKIIYRDHAIRLFPHEFTKLSDEHLNWYVIGMPGEGIPTHELVSSLVPEISINVSGVQRTPLQEIFGEIIQQIYDAAILDGATHDMAKMLSLGMDVSAPEATPIPLLGWYKCKPEYAQIYCEEYEMEETYPKESEPCLSK